MKISILGCGWLGLPLAKELRKNGHEVKGSTTTASKIPLLEKAGIKAFHVSLSSEAAEGDQRGLLSETDCLIIDIPPGIRKNPGADFFGSMKLLAKEIEGMGIGRVIFVSSISVYNDSPTFPVLTEKDEANNPAEGAKQLRASEELFLNNPLLRASVVRFGGLIGNGRHPVNQLAGRKNLSNPNAPVNLIGLKDCIGILSRMAEAGTSSGIYNAVFPKYPSKEEYYLKKAKEEGLPLPEFDHTGASSGKVIKSLRVEKELGFVFQEGI